MWYKAKGTFKRILQFKDYKAHVHIFNTYPKSIWISPLLCCCQQYYVQFCSNLLWSATGIDAGTILVFYTHLERRFLRKYCLTAIRMTNYAYVNNIIKAAFENLKNSCNNISLLLKQGKYYVSLLFCHIWNIVCLYMVPA